MRLNSGRRVFQKGEDHDHKDDHDLLDGKAGRGGSRRLNRTRLPERGAYLSGNSSNSPESSSGSMPEIGRGSGNESDGLEEGELASTSRAPYGEFTGASRSPSPHDSSRNYYDREDGYLDNSSPSGSESSYPECPRKRTAESLLRSLRLDNRLEYVDPKTLTGVVHISKYSTSRKIGEGSFGEVIIATNVKTNRRVALKRVIVHKETDGVPITALREIMILKSLNHENIIKLKEIALGQAPQHSFTLGPTSSPASQMDFTPRTIYMVFPYMEHDLAGLLDNPDINLTPAQIKSYMKQLLEGIAYLHREDILHRDIKSANILVGDSGILKIADFGLARYYDRSSDSSELTPTVITVWYRPPELLLGSKVYTSAVDIWGAGCIFAEIWDRKAIFAGQKEMDVLKKIFQICGVPSREEWSEFPSLAKDVGIHPRPAPKRIYERFRSTLDPTTIMFIRYLFTYDPSKRPSAAQALRHEYFLTDPPPARRNTSDFPPWADSHELGTRFIRDKDGNPMENVHPSKSSRKPRVHKDILLDSRGKVIPRARVRMRNSPLGYDSEYHRSHSQAGSPTKYHNDGLRPPSVEGLSRSSSQKRKHGYSCNQEVYSDRSRQHLYSKDSKRSCRYSDEDRYADYRRSRRSRCSSGSPRARRSPLSSPLGSTSSDRSLENGECRER